MFQYSGPGSQQVANTWRSGWNDYWFMKYLTQQGYIGYCIDNRGTGFKGATKKVTPIRTREMQ
jgi:dipeptidyl-peptidase-4